MSHLHLVPNPEKDETLEGAEVLEKSKPNSLDEYIGQALNKELLKRMLSNCRERNSVLTHLLILGPSGGGKTTLAQLLARELNKGFHEIMASKDLKRNDLCIIFEKCQKGDLLYIDEAHDLSDDCQQLLFRFLDTGNVPLSGEKKPDSQLEQKIGPLTVIVSTNRPSGIRKELANRLFTIELSDYTSDDLSHIAYAALGGPDKINVDALKLVVDAAHGSPRTLLMHLRTIRFLFGNVFIEVQQVKDFFRLKNIGREGLSNYHQTILTFLSIQPACTARLGAIADRLGLDSSFVRKELEPVLIKKGFIALTSLGRILTKKGREFVAEGIAEKTA